MNLALFDFDGTLTSRDTLFAFLIFNHGPVRFWFNLILLAPIFLMYKLRIIPNWKAKEMVLSFFLKGTSTRVFQVKCQEFAENIIPILIRKNALRKLQEHRDNQERVIVVSASPENWIRPWCKNQGVELIATKLENVNSTLTGKIKGKNCYGREKVRRLRLHVNLDDYQKIYAYGDSSGDRELLDIATDSFYRFFNDQ